MNNVCDVTPLVELYLRAANEAYYAKDAAATAAYLDWVASKNTL